MKFFLILILASQCFGATPLEDKNRPVANTAAPCPPEAITRNMDGLIELGGKVELRLVANTEAGSLPANQRGVWVFMKDGVPVPVVIPPGDTGKQQSDGMTARALKKARAFMNEHLKSRGPVISLQRTDDLATIYRMQICSMSLVDKETESWKISYQPVQNTKGGEIWLRFDRDHEVSADFGK